MEIIVGFVVVVGIILIDYRLNKIVRNTKLCADILEYNSKVLKAQWDILASKSQPPGPS